MMMRSSSFLKATTAVATMTAVVAVLLADTAEAATGSYSIPLPASTPDFLLSPIFLWVTANVIIVWLVSSSRRRGSRGTTTTTTDDDDTTSTAHDGDEVVVPGATVDTFVSEYDAFSDAAAPPVSSRRPAAEAARDARRAARKSDRRPRARKTPEPEPAHEEETAAPPAAASVAGPESGSRPTSGAGEDDEEEDVSMDSLWASIVQRRAARPVVVRKSESWGNDEMPRLQRVAENAAARRRQVRKSVSAVVANNNKAAEADPTPAPAQVAQAAVRQTMGWRTRDVLVGISPDDLLRRAESFIRRQREHLRLQRQESEQRQVLMQSRVHGPGAAAAAPPAPLIRAGV